jgi:hypothetical protein
MKNILQQRKTFNYRRVFGSDGATAFALPTKFGQTLLLKKANHEITWISYDADGSIWFEDSIPFRKLSILQL